MRFLSSTKCLRAAQSGSSCISSRGRLALRSGAGGGGGGGGDGRDAWGATIDCGSAETTELDG